MLFDALGYFSRINPTEGYTVAVLTGGMMNITLRATKIKSASGGRFPNQRNLILKYAPPFAAGVGEKLPITTFRQVSCCFHCCLSNVHHPIELIFTFSQIVGNRRQSAVSLLGRSQRLPEEYLFLLHSHSP